MVQLKEFVTSGILLDPLNYLTILAGVGLTQFVACGWLLELLAARGILNETLVVVLEVTYLSWMLVYPVLMIQWIGSMSLAAAYFMLFTVSLFLKLTSFHHVMADNRRLIVRHKKQLAAGKKEEADLPTVFNINEQTFKIAIQYPNNLRIGHYLRFMLAPTCCYQHIYPTSKQIRLGYLAKRATEFAACYYFMWYLVYQHMVPIAHSAIVHFQTKNYWQILLATLQMSVPAAYCWLTVFYSTFHSYLNFWAEVTQFADRRFYSDWWNASNLGEYWRKWNQPIHNYLLRHIYFPLRRAGMGSAACLFTTFTVSAIFHEYIVVGIFSVINLVAFILMMINIPCMMLQRQLKNVISGNTNNLLFWLFYIILGQPFGIILCYYQMIDKHQ